MKCIFVFSCIFIRSPQSMQSTWQNVHNSKWKFWRESFPIRTFNLFSICIKHNYCRALYFCQQKTLSRKGNHLLFLYITTRHNVRVSSGVQFIEKVFICIVRKHPTKAVYKKPFTYISIILSCSCAIFNGISRTTHKNGGPWAWENIPPVRTCSILILSILENSATTTTTKTLHNTHCTLWSFVRKTGGVGLCRWCHSKPQRKTNERWLLFHPSERMHERTQAKYSQGEPIIGGGFSSPG